MSTVQFHLNAQIVFRHVHILYNRLLFIDCKATLFHCKVTSWVPQMVNTLAESTGTVLLGTASSMERTMPLESRKPDSKAASAPKCTASVQCRAIHGFYRKVFPQLLKCAEGRDVK